MEIKTFFDNVFKYGVDKEKVQKIQKLYGNTIDDQVTILVLSCMRERTLTVEGNKNYQLLTLNDAQDPKFVKIGLMPIFKLSENEIICYNFNRNEEKKIASTCLYNTKTKRIIVGYPGLILFFRDELPELVDKSQNSKSDFSSLFCVTPDKKYLFNFEYDAIEGAVQINKINIISDEQKSIDVKIIVPAKPNAKFNNVFSSKKNTQKYLEKTTLEQVGWPQELSDMVESPKFNVEKMLDRIKELDIYANCAPIYETVMRELEKGKISVKSHKPSSQNNLERMSFLDFNCLFLTTSDMSKVEIAIFAPIIYAMEDKYFNAVLNYLQTGKEDNICYGKYSTDVIKNSYHSCKVNYIQAIVILNNIEKSNGNGPIIYWPDYIE